MWLHEAKPQRDGELLVINALVVVRDVMRSCTQYWLLTFAGQSTQGVANFCAVFLMRR
jgi:hypothetical protein